MKLTKLIILLLVFLLITGCNVFKEDDFPTTDFYLSIINSDGSNLEHILDENYNYGSAKYIHNDEKIIMFNGNGFSTCNIDGSSYDSIIDSLNFSALDSYSLKPNQENLVFSSEGSIYELDIITKNVNTIYNFNAEIGYGLKPTYSTLGNLIVFKLTEYVSDEDLYINKIGMINLESNDLQIIFETNSEYSRNITCAVFDNNEDKIIFNTSSTGELHKINIDGTGLETICNGVQYCNSINSNAEYITFESKETVYSYHKESALLRSHGKGFRPEMHNTKLIFNNNGLYHVDLVSIEKIKLADSPGGSQSFSSDGSQILFKHRVDSNKSKNPVE